MRKRALLILLAGGLAAAGVLLAWAEGPFPQEPPARFVLIAHHNDNLWREGWVVHEGPTSPALACAALARLG